MTQKNGNKNISNYDREELDYGMEKDDVLNRPRRFNIIEIVPFKRMNIVEVLMGADDPLDLWGEDVKKAAKDSAENKLNSRCDLINESDVIVNGQNDPPFKLFTFNIDKQV